MDELNLQPREKALRHRHARCLAVPFGLNAGDGLHGRAEVEIAKPQQPTRYEMR
jgi:hypothetical protein